MSEKVAKEPTSAEKDSDRFLISDLCDLVGTYMDQEQVKQVYDAYLFGAQAHEGQIRISGEPYIYHPIAVARILAEMHMDVKSIVASILHDVLEDTAATRKLIAREFGDDVAMLVDGVSKMTHIKFKNKIEEQAENTQKVLLVMSQDIRVIMIKLADRLHNMRTLGVMRPDKRRRIARETLEIYAPIATRLGMNKVRLELEDLGLAALYPQRYRILKEAVIKARGNRKEILKKIEASIKSRLREENLNGDVIGREKHLYSIYTKMVSKGLSFREVFDMYAFRIVVETVDQCYRVLGVMHNLYKPVPGKFKDYIAMPKFNLYQSLHTTVVGPDGKGLEVQIRTLEMHEQAEAGIANTRRTRSRKTAWLCSPACFGRRGPSRSTSKSCVRLCGCGGCWQRPENWPSRLLVWPRPSTYMTSKSRPS